MRWMLELWWRLVRFGFRLLYNELAWTYDSVSAVVSLGAWRCWTQTALLHLPQTGAGRVLEIAHGTGNLQLDLLKAGYNTTACDLSPYMGRITRRKLARNGLHAHLVQSRGQVLPFQDWAFTGVVTTFPTWFFRDQNTRTEVYRVLEPGGRWVMVLSGVFEGGGIFPRLLEFAYRVTGQRAGDMDAALEALQRDFRLTGFSTRIVHESCPRSRVILLIAEKSG